MGTKAWRTRMLLLLVLLWRLTCAASFPLRVPSCPKLSVSDLIVDFRDSFCPISTSAHSQSIEFVAVIEGDEVSLQKALHMVYTNSHEYVAVLFYASWCPFSSSFRLTFDIISSCYPSVPHFAIEESAVRPSILSKYGVHGFPTLFLLNSTMRARYHGNRTFESLGAFYGDVTGLKNSVDKTSLEKIRHLSNHEKHGSTHQESYTLSRARSPGNLLREETYLALATTFVLFRLLNLLYPTLLLFAQLSWRRLVRNMKLGTSSEHPSAYVKRAIHLFHSLNEPCKRNNLQGTMNARAWASKSLATVSIGDASTSRTVPVTRCR